jgi:hypothetical protein
LYRLLEVDLSANRLDATVTTIEFARHALTTELMEGELLDAVAAGGGPLPCGTRTCRDVSFESS